MKKKTREAMNEYYRKLAKERPEILANIIIANEQMMMNNLERYYKKQKQLKGMLAAEGQYKVYTEVREGRAIGSNWDTYSEQTIQAVKVMPNEKLALQQENLFSQVCK